MNNPPSGTTSRFTRPASRRRPVEHRLRLAAAAAVFLASAAATARPAYALFGVGDIVSDPLAQAKNVEKVAQMLLQLEQMARQLQQLRAQVESLGSLLDDPGGAAFGRAAQAMDSLTRLQQTLDRWQRELPADPESGTITIDALPEHTARSRAYLRERLAGAEAALSAVEQDRDRVTAEVSATVEAGNAAPGPKAAQQAGNQLQALIASEQAKLQALRAMRGRLAADADAAGQADEAAAAAVRRGPGTAGRGVTNTTNRNGGRQ